MEDIIFQGQTPWVLLIFHEVCTHLDGYSTVFLFVIEVVYLSGSQEEDTSRPHLVVCEINGMYAFALLKPDYLIEGMYMGCAVIYLVLQKNFWHVTDAKPIATGCCAYGL